MMRRGLMGAALAFSLAAFAGVSGYAANTKAACACCGPDCTCTACSCDEKAKAGQACDCCGGAACCSAKVVKSCCSN